MKRKILSFAALLSAFISPVALSQTCDKAPSEAATKLDASLRGLLEKKQVQFVGYTARKLASNRSQSCADMRLYWALYNDAQAMKDQSEMWIQGNYAHTKIRPRFPDDAKKQGREGSCEVIFDLPKAGFPKDPEISCPSNVFYHAAEEALKGVVFAPKDMDQEFIPAENVVVPIKFEMWWRKNKKPKNEKKVDMDTESAQTYNGNTMAKKDGGEYE